MESCRNTRPKDKNKKYILDILTTMRTNIYAQNAMNDFVDILQKSIAMFRRMIEPAIGEKHALPAIVAHFLF